MDIKGSTWLIGIIGTWFLLTVIADIPATEDLATALALAIAVTATFAVGPEAAANAFNTGGTSNVG